MSLEWVVERKLMANGLNTNLTKKFDMSGKLFCKQLLKGVVNLLYIYS